MNPYRIAEGMVFPALIWLVGVVGVGLIAGWVYAAVWGVGSITFVGLGFAIGSLVEWLGKKANQYDYEHHPDVNKRKDDTCQ